MDFVYDSIWPDIRGLLIAEAQLSGLPDTVDTFYLQRYIEYKTDLMALKGMSPTDFADKFEGKDYFYDITVDRLLVRQKIFERGMAMGTGLKLHPKLLSGADAQYKNAVKQFYYDIVVANVYDSKLIPGGQYFDDFYNSISVTDKDAMYEMYLDQVANSKQNAINMYTDAWTRNPATNPSPGTPEFDSLVNVYVHNVEFELPKSMPSPLDVYHDQQRQFYIEHYTKNPTFLPERNEELYSDYSKLVRYIYSGNAQFTDACMLDWQTTALADYDALRVKAQGVADSLEVLNGYEKSLMWYAKMKEYNVARQITFGTDIGSDYFDYFTKQQSFANDLARSQGQRYVMDSIEYQSWLEDRPNYIENVVTEMRNLFGTGTTATSDGLTLVDIRNWYRRNGLADDGTPLEQESELQAIWNSAKNIALMDRDTALEKLSERYTTFGKFMKFGQIDLNDVQWQLFSRSQMYRNLAVNVSYNSSYRMAVKGIRILSEHASTIFWFITAFMAYEFGCLKNATFALYIDGISANKDQMDIDLRKCSELNALLKNSSFAFFPWIKGALLMYHDAAELVIEAHKFIESGFTYAQENAYRLDAVVEDITNNVATLAFLPDKINKTKWPVEFTGQKAATFYAVGTVVNIAISRDNPMDISTWIKETHTVTNVHDGDTITLDDGTKVRTYPNNAPEMKNPDGSPNPAGVLSQQALSDLVLGKSVDIYMDPTNPVDVYGRTLAYVYLNGMDVGQYMIDKVGNPIYYLTNAWFPTTVYAVDSRSTALDPNTEKYTHPEITTQELLDQYPTIVVNIPNYFMPFAADIGDTVYLRISQSEKLSFETATDCSVPGEVHLIAAPSNLEYIKVDPTFLGIYITSPCGTGIRATIERFFTCERDLKVGEIAGVHDNVDGIFSVFTVTGTAYLIYWPTDMVPGNVANGDSAIFTFKPVLPYITFNVVVDSVSSPWVTLKTTSQTAPQSFLIPETLIPFPVAAGDKVEIELGKNIGDFFVADFHARLGNNLSNTALFVKMPENDPMFNIPLSIVLGIVQDPLMKIDLKKLQVNDMAYFKIIDKSFTNSFKAELDRIDGANGIWKVLPDEVMEISIPTVIVENFLTTKVYASYPVCTISVKQMKAASSYSTDQEVTIIATDEDNTTIQTVHIKFGNPQFTLPTRLFSWLPAVNDTGILNIANYSGLVSNAVYIDSISDVDAKLVCINKKDLGGIYYPKDKLPLYLRRFDVCRLQIRTHGWAKTPSGQTAQDIVDKYTKTKTTKTGIVKRKIPAQVPNPNDMFVDVRTLDNGFAYAITQRTDQGDNGAYVDIPVYLLPPDTDVGDSLSLIIDSHYYTDTYFTAQFMSLTPDGTCSFLVLDSMNYPFTIPLNMLPSFSVPTDVIGFRFQKKTAKNTNDIDFILSVTDIGIGTVTLKNNHTNSIFTLSQDLLCYVRLPAPNDDIINLTIGDKFKLEVTKIIGHSF